MSKELPTLRGFTYETAAEHLHTRVPVASRSSPVDEIRRSLGKKGYDSLTHIAILEGTKLVGVLTIENLFSTPEGSVAEQVMDAQPPVVAPGTDQEVAAWRAVEHGESALAVVDEEGDFLACLLTTEDFAADMKPVAKSLLWPSSSVQAAFLSAG